MQRKLHSVISFTLLLSLLLSPLVAHTASAALQVSSQVYFSEDFSGEVFPPPDWTVYNLDEEEPNWERVTDDYFSSPASASHRFNVPPQTYQSDWLVAPAITLPDNQAALFTFYEKAERPKRYGYQGVHISTGDCTYAGGEFTELVEVDDSEDAWRQIEVDLTAYVGQSICLAFVYEGDQATRWSIDDILVASVAHALSLAAESYAKYGLPGETVEYELTLTNLGHTDDTFSLETSGAEWDVALDLDPISLESGASTTISASVLVPNEAVAGDWDAFTITATSQGDPTVSKLVELTTTAGSDYNVSLTTSQPALTGIAGETVEYELTLTNTGITSDTYNLSYSGEEWNVNLSDTVSPLLESGASTQITAFVQIPLDADPDDWDDFTVKAVSQGDELVSDEVTLTTTVEAVYDLSLTADQSAKNRLPGETVEYELTLTNLGNALDTYDLDLSGQVWEVTLSKDEVTLAAGDGEVVKAYVTIPEDAVNGDTDSVLVTAASRDSEGLTAEVTLTTSVLAPAASFEPSSMVVLVGEEIEFTNTTTGSIPLSYLWDFGDDSETSTLTHPAHTYTAEGVYTVSLTASNLIGNSTYELDISVGYAPTAAFTASPEVVTAGELVTFTNTSTGTAPLEFTWDFGDGSDSTAANPTHTYSLPGFYSITLQVSNPFGEDEASFEILVVPAVPPEGADLELILEVDPLPVKINKPVTITATVTNHGPDKATGVFASGELPDFINYLDGSSGCSVTNGILTCNLGEIEPGHSKEAWISLIFTQSGTYQVILEAAGFEADPNPENNEAAVAILVEMNALYLPFVIRP